MKSSELKQALYRASCDVTDSLEQVYTSGDRKQAEQLRDHISFCSACHEEVIRLNEKYRSEPKKSFFQRFIVPTIVGSLVLIGSSLAYDAAGGNDRKR